MILPNRVSLDFDVFKIYMQPLCAYLVFDNKKNLRPMKPKYLLIMVALAPVLLSVYCDFEPHTAYSPILMERAELEYSVMVTTPKNLKNPGKIYLFGDVVFVVEKLEGIHLIDNSDRTNPKQYSFLNVPGCVDLAVKDRVMYVDNAVDLIAVDISDVKNLKVTERHKNVFPELTPPDLEFVPSMYSKYSRPENTIIVAWELKN